MQHPIITVCTQENEITMPDSIEMRTELVISLCEKLLEKNTIVFVGGKAHNYSSLPFFIHEIHSSYPLNLDAVYDRFSSEIEHIQREQLSILDFLTNNNQTNG